ncbi:hypothetical protein N9A28_00025 [Sulfurimonas sp.]|nr:hypothetical protein [Sulfurimonas sp.]
MNDFIDMIEQTPKIETQKCKLVSILLWLTLQYSIYVITIIAFYMYDYFIAFLALVLSFIVIGIVRSKIRNSVIPVKQREYHYTDRGIADWYTARELCLETKEDTKVI